MTERNTRMDALMASWPLERLVGQMFLLAFPGKDADKAAGLIRDYNIAGCYVSQDNAERFEESRALSDKLNSFVTEADGLPLLLGVDQEGAWGYLVPESRTGPGNLALGATGDCDLARRMYTVFAQEMRQAGMTVLLGPCADINLNEKSAIIDTRSFGADPVRVGAFCAAAVEGGHRGGILTCAKHFPGHGSTDDDTHRDIPVVDKPLASLWEEDLKPFRSAIDAGVDVIMTSHIRYPQLDPDYPATLSHVILQDVLRRDLGFDGVILSDSMNMGAIRKHFAPEEAALRAIEAGIDLIMLSEEHYDHDSGYLQRQEGMIRSVVQAVQAGRISRARVEDSVRRILQLRYRVVSLAETAVADADPDVEVQASSAAIRARNIPREVWRRAGTGRLVCVNATPRDAYDRLMNARGIGPNQTTGAFDAFRRELSTLWPDTVFAEREDFPSVRLGDTDLLLVVSENHPLPGEDFAGEDVVAFVRDLLSAGNNTGIHIRLGSDYPFLADMSSTPMITSYSGRECAAEACARYVVEHLNVSG